MDFPRTVDEITPELLTQVLRESASIKKARVVSFENSSLEDGMVGDVNRVELTYDVAEPGAPTELIAKHSNADPEKRSLMDSIGLYEREVRFYDELAGISGMAMPQVHFTGYESETGSSVLLQEDLGYLRSVSQSQNCGFEDANSALTSVAIMHAKWWNNDQLSDLPWLFNYGNADLSQYAADTFSEHLNTFVEIADEYLAPGVETLIRRLAEKYVELGISTTLTPVTLNHGDFKPANIFFDDSPNAVSPIVTFDWQVAQIGRPGSDIAQFLITSFENERRRELEQSLISNYYDALADNGITDYSRDELISDIQTGLLIRVPHRMLAVVFGAEEMHKSEERRANLAAMCDRFQTLIDWNCDEVIPK